MQDSKRERERENRSKRYFPPLLASVTSSLRSTHSVLVWRGGGSQGLEPPNGLWEQSDSSSPTWLLTWQLFSLGLREVGKQHVLPALPSPASQTCGFLFCCWEHQDSHIQEGPLRRTSLLRAKRGSSQDTSQTQKSGDFFYIYVCVYIYILPLPPPLILKYIFWLFFPPSTPLFLKMEEMPGTTSRPKRPYLCYLQR